MPQAGVHPTVPYGQQAGGQGWGLDPGQQYSVAGQPGQSLTFAGPQGGQQGWNGNGQQAWGADGGMQAFDASGRPVQQGPHPTVPFGQQPPAGGWQGQQGQGQGWGGVPQQGWNQQGQGAQGWQNQGQPSFSLRDDMVLDGPNVPAELRGRTFGQVKAIYTALANDWLMRQGRSSAPGGVPQQGQQPNPQGQGQAQFQQQGQGQGQQGRTQWDWANPAEAFRSVVREELGTMLQPVFAQTNATGVAQARQIAMEQVPDFGYLEGTIMQHVATLPPESLTNPTVWVNAARLARGELMETGQYRFNPQARGGQQVGWQGGWQNGQGQVQGGAPPGFGVPRQSLSNFVSPQGNVMGAAPNGFGYGSPGMISVPANQPHQFFSESPTPPVFGEFGAGGLSQAEMFVAREMGMAPEQYLSWRGGVQR